MRLLQKTGTFVSMVAFFFVAAAALSGYDAAAPQERSGRKAQRSDRALDDVRTTLKEAKRSLAREGNYACCISPSCDFCALSVGKCPCQDNLSAGDPVCHECKGGWQAGYGVIEGMNPASVKTLTPEMLKMMYDERAKKYLKRQ